MATSCPLSLFCLTEGLQLFTGSGREHPSMQQGCEPNRDRAWSLVTCGRWREEGPSGTGLARPVSWRKQAAS